MCFCVGASRPARASLHRLQRLLALVHQLVGPLENIIVALVQARNVDRQAARYNDGAVLLVLVDLLAESALELFPVRVILPLQDRNEFVASDTEDRAVVELAADEPARFLDVFVACFVAKMVVDRLEAVEIKDDNAVFFERTVFEAGLNVDQCLQIRELVPDTGEAVQISLLADLLHLATVLDVFALVDERMDHARADETAHGIKRQTREDHLQRDKHRHDEAREAYYGVMELFGVFRSGGDRESIDRRSEEQDHLHEQRDEPGRKRHIFFVPVKRESNRNKDIYDQHNDLDNEDCPSAAGEEFSRHVFAVRKRDHGPGPEEDRHNHCGKIHTCNSESRNDPSPVVKQSPQ